jgi:DNA-binding beta-propeller fold protein YncE
MRSVASRHIRCAALQVAGAALLLGEAACASGVPTVAAQDSSSPLKLEGDFSLPGVKGRIDHLAVDLAGKRLFVAEVENGSAEVIDLVSGKSLARIGGLHEPQGIAWLSATNEFLVAAGDGTVHFFSGQDYRETAAIDLGSDADDVRVDPRNGNAVVGYGNGGLAVIDPATHRVVSRVTFKGHPEGFALAGGKAWVNDPDDGAVLSLDLDGGKVLARWPTGLHRLNFPIALSADGREVTIAYRLPAALARIDAPDGTTRAVHDTCGDADDLFIAGAVTLVVCGSGQVELVEGDKPKTRVETRGGARTGLYVPELNSLFVALPARGGKSAAIWKLRFSGRSRPG